MACIQTLIERLICKLFFIATPQVDVAWFSAMKIARCFLFILIFIFPVIGEAKNNLISELALAQKMLAKGDYAAAYGKFLKLQDKSALAPFILGLYYQQGWGRPKNPVLACLWFEKAAKRKVPGGLNFLADCLVAGTHREKSQAEALDLYLQAAERGYIGAYQSAAEILIRGNGVTQNLSLGLEYCIKAAQSGALPAMLQLARYYWQDPQVPQNLAAARYWFGKAAEEGSLDAWYAHANMVATGAGGEKNLPEAIRQMELLAARGYPPAYLPLAQMYSNLPVDRESGLLPPEVIAKIYFWNRAARKNLDAYIPADRQAMDQIDDLLHQVMPQEWGANLDRQLDQYLNQFSSSQASH